MPYAPVSIVEAILRNRNNIKARDQIKVCRILFDLALRDRDAAEAMFAVPNRFIQMIPDVISIEKLLEFACIHSQNLVERLIRFARLSDPTLLQKMRQAVVVKQNLDQQFNALLKQANPIEREVILPLAGRQQDDEEIGRTHLAIQNNPLIKDRNNIKGIMLSNEFIPMVNRHTRDFNRKLCSVGAATSREAIFLDPDDQLLKKLYEELRAKLPASNEPLVILEEVKKLTRSCFTGTNVDSLIKDNLKHGKQIIPLNEFILKRQGVCRHHTLLNAYFLSRLVQDGLLQGKVIHHRQDFAQGGAHTWNVFHAQNGKIYSLDSLWNDVTCITDNPGAINSLYRHNVEAKIKEMHFSAPQEEGQIKELRGRINQIKHYIETTHFSVGDYFLWKGGRMLQLEDGSKKRVPHRVYEIYQAIKHYHIDTISPLSPQELWQNIEMFAQKALKHPRPGRDKNTTEFYNNIVNNNSVLDKKPLNQYVPNEMAPVPGF